MLKGRRWWWCRGRHCQVQVHVLSSVQYSTVQLVHFDRANKGSRVDREKSKSKSRTLKSILCKSKVYRVKSFIQTFYSLDE